MGLIQTPDQLRFSWKAVIDALEDERWVKKKINQIFN